MLVPIISSISIEQYNYNTFEVLTKQALILYDLVAIVFVRLNVTLI